MAIYIYKINFIYESSLNLPIKLIFSFFQNILRDMDKFKTLPKEGFTNDEIEKKYDEVRSLKSKIKKLYDEIGIILDKNYVSRETIYKKALETKKIDYFVCIKEIKEFVNTPIIINIKFNVSFYGKCRASIRERKQKGNFDVSELECKEILDLKTLDDLTLMSCDEIDCEDIEKDFYANYINSIPDDDIDHDDYGEDNIICVESTLKFKCYLVTRKKV